MRSSSILVKLVTLASLVGIVTAAEGDQTVSCSKCTACCVSGFQCIYNSARDYVCAPVSQSTFGTHTPDSTKSSTTSAATATAKSTCSAGGQCKSQDLGKTTTEIPRTTCSICLTSTSVPIVATPTPTSNSTIKPTGMPKNSTAPAHTGTARPGNRTVLTTGGSGGGAGAKTGTAPTGGSGTNTVAPTATSSRATVGSTGAADRNGASVLAVVVLGSLVWFLG